MASAPPSPRVRAAVPGDGEVWFRMRRDLWPDCPDAEHRGEIAAHFAGESPRGPSGALCAVDADERILGFAEVSLRDCAEGCRSSPVAYLEGWYVAADARGRGVGRALVRAAEAWGRERGCKEIASDAEVDNEVSCSAHRALGFEDLGPVRLFRKAL